MDLAPLLGTPGVRVEAPFEQVARRGFFLLASEPLAEDPAAVSARFAGAPESGALAAVHGTRRTAVRRTATGTHERFAQLLRGARVVGSDVDLHEDERGIYGVTGDRSATCTHATPVRGRRWTRARCCGRARSSSASTTSARRRPSPSSSRSARAARGPTRSASACSRTPPTCARTCAPTTSPCCSRATSRRRPRAAPACTRPTR